LVANLAFNLFLKTSFDVLNRKLSFEEFMYFVENGSSQINKVGWIKVTLALACLMS
jgi:hypothetical protein